MEEQRKRGDWMQTYTGIQFWPLQSEVEDVNITDIAHSLSLLCRFNGHCKKFYSVAEHCIHVMSIVPPEHKFAALLHDASEAYLSDVIRPIKPYLKNYARYEQWLQLTINEAFNIPATYLMSVMKEYAVIKQADNAVLTAEANQVMITVPPEPWYLPEKAADITIVYLSPSTAETLFLEQFTSLKGQ